MIRFLAFFGSAAAFFFSSNLVLTNETELLELEGISLQMTEAQVHAVMTKNAYTASGESTEKPNIHVRFDDLVRIKRVDRIRFAMYKLTSDRRYDGPQGHLLIRFMPFRDRTIVTSITLYPKDIQWRTSVITDCQKFGTDMRNRYAPDDTDVAAQHGPWQAPMMVDGEMKDDGQQVRIACSPRFNPTVTLSNPYAQRLLLQQINQALAQ
ncbi:MAG: hypothetical protein ABJO01_06005 [Parasphingorhabdus sp.]|uniref:hypothetical protein n=1 Tax=Parasphingorhabdus sp. TaxID=2709688 RepID=UPI003298B895